MMGSCICRDWIGYRAHSSRCRERGSQHQLVATDTVLAGRRVEDTKTDFQRKKEHSLSHRRGESWVQDLWPKDLGSRAQIALTMAEKEGSSAAFLRRRISSLIMGEVNPEAAPQSRSVYELARTWASCTPRPQQHDSLHSSQPETPLPRLVPVRP
jgi:hypothetical protein